MRKVKVGNLQPLDNNYRIELLKGTFIEQQMERAMEFEINVEDECPICHYGIDMSQDLYRNYHDIHSDDLEFNIFTIHCCQHCHNGFVVRHHMRVVDGVIVEESQMLFPSEIKELFNDIEISSISPRFCDIYNQCHIAKNNNLTYLYGMGYRKAIEYLVKDYAIKENPGEQAVIENKTLHNCIVDYFKNSEAKDALLACKWIGNDETHYVNNNTIEELFLCEQLIEDVLHYIRREQRQKRAQQVNLTKGTH